MKDNRYIFAALLSAAALTILTIYSNFIDIRYEKAVFKIFETASSLKEISLPVKDEFYTQNLSNVIKVYEALDEEGSVLGTGIIAREKGYNGHILAAIGIDDNENKLIGLEIITHTETPHYGGYITQKWFKDRFIDKKLHSFLRLVALDAETDSDIVQVTGATLSSRGVVEAANTAICAYNYMFENNRMARPVVNITEDKKQEEETFQILYGDGKSVRLTMDDLKSYSNEKVECVLQKTTGTKINLVAEGPTLKTVLEKHGIRLDAYKGIGITGRDGYYALISKDIMDSRQIILGYIFNGKAIPEDEKPIRIVIPGEFGVYWVKMVSDIELYDDIAEKKIKSVKLFYELAKDIKPYMYEYYGQKDESIEVGQLLNKLENVNPKGFFTMASSDGLIKNETIAMVKSRYYIKITGENAPMNVMPSFKLGSNVKHIAYFSTTEDTVIFPSEMEKLTGTKEIGGISGLPLKETLQKSGMINIENKSFTLKSSDGNTQKIHGRELDNCIIAHEGKTAYAVIQQGEAVIKLDDLLEINME